MTTSRAWGVGLSTIADDGRVLDTWFPHLGLGDLPDQRRGPYGVPADLASLEAADPARQIRQETAVVEVDLGSDPQGPVDAYLRLHLLSHRLITPAQVDLEAVVAALPLNVWTSAGPCQPHEFDHIRLQLRIAAKGAPVDVHAVSKIPNLIDYVLPPEVAIADGARVRLGAYLSPGTKVTQEGFVDAGAGTLGAAYIQGRVNRGVLIGHDTHVGGSAAIMPAEPGETVTIGAGCLIGANAGVGISLGDHCTVEAGLFVTAGTKVTIRTGAKPHARVLPARDLADIPGLLFRRNSTTGVVEAFEQNRP